MLQSDYVLIHYYGVYNCTGFNKQIILSWDTMSTLDTNYWNPDLYTYANIVIFSGALTWIYSAASCKHI